MVFDRQAKPGETVYLRSKRDTPLATYSYSDLIEERNRIQEEKESAEKKKLEEEKKAKEAAEKKKLEKELEQLKLEEAKKELEELECRKDAAAELEAEVQKQKEQFDAEQHPPIEVIEEEVEKAAPEEVVVEKPYTEVEVETYTVKAGDTLYSLSNRFHISVEQLKELNNMEDNTLRVGQVLVVSP